MSLLLQFRCVCVIAYIVLTDFAKFQPTFASLTVTVIALPCDSSYYMLALGKSWEFSWRKRLCLSFLMSDICKVEYAHIWAMVQYALLPRYSAFLSKARGWICLGTKDRFFIYEIKSNECFTVLFKVLYLWPFTRLRWILKVRRFWAYVVHNPLTS